MRGATCVFCLTEPETSAELVLDSGFKNQTRRSTYVSAGLWRFDYAP